MVKPPSVSARGGIRKIIPKPQYLLNQKRCAVKRPKKEKALEEQKTD